MKAYKLFKCDIGGYPMTLMHTWWGIRQLPLSTLIRAEHMQVWNPGKKTGPGFTSGWHCVPTYNEVVEYLSRFKDLTELYICEVMVRRVESKPRSTANVLLARQMVIPSDAWAERVRGSDA